jgi:flagellar biogenesis protein FliO
MSGELLREELTEDPYFGYFEEGEMYDLHHTMLDRPLGGRLPEFGGEELQSGGWRDKLAQPNLGPIISVGSTLLIVIAAFFILALFLRKVSPQSSRALPKEAFECLGRYYLTQKHQLQLLRMGNRIILVSVMPDGVSTLAEITDPDEAVSLLGLCRRLDTNSATEMFRKTVAGISEEELSRPYGRSVAATQRGRQPAASLDLYSEPEESLAAILARGRQYR